MPASRLAPWKEQRTEEPQPRLRALGESPDSPLVSPSGKDSRAWGQLLSLGNLASWEVCLSRDVMVVFPSMMMSSMCLFCGSWGLVFLPAVLPGDFVTSLLCDWHPATCMAGRSQRDGKITEVRGFKV